MGWAGTEFETIDLGDEWCNKRAIGLVERLSAQRACGGQGRRHGGVYRFFGNEEVD